jgi:hypothetical protein
MPGGPLRVVALYVSGVFVAFYVVTVAQIVWVCEMNVQLNKAGSVPLYLPHFAMNGSSRVPRCQIKKQVPILQMTGVSI